MRIWWRSSSTRPVYSSRPDFEAAMQHIAAGVVAAGAAIESVELSRLLEPERDLPLPPILAERNEVTTHLLAGARRTPFICRPGPLAWALRACADWRRNCAVAMCPPGSTH
jgi:hypothetical protein